MADIMTGSTVVQFITEAKRHPAGTKLRICLLVLIAVLCAFSDFRLIINLNEKDSLPPLLFVPAYLISFLIAASLLLSKITRIRTLVQILLFSSLYTDVLYLIIGGYPFSFPDAINLVNNPEYASGAFMTFMAPLVLAFAGAAMIYSAIHFLIKPIPGSSGSASIWLFAGIQIMLFAYSRKQTAIYDFFPSIYRVTGNLLAASNFRPEAYWRRADVLEQPGSIKVNHVFLVVDESVTGPALSINGAPYPTSPFLRANAGHFINFGTATSFTNFSAGSNLALMSGMLADELPDRKFISFAKPSIFQFAKKAGYHTYLLDAQTNGEKLQNYTSARDLSYIDSLFKPGAIYPGIPSYSRDSLLVEKIAVIAAVNTPTFTYVNKAGAHWPYHTNVPRDSIKHRLAFSSKAAHPLTYFKSLYWNVDRFWEMLITKLPANSEVLILYTSDHGENYAAQPARIKHASIYKTPVIEGLVPLMAFDRARFFPTQLSRATDKYSHQYVFPTLLLTMGYSKDFVGSKYGRSLLDPPYQKPRWFHTGDLFGRGRTNKVFVDKEQCKADKF